MLGKIYHCSMCDFEFNSGWSHHAGGQFVFCVDCGADFVLGGGRSNWGVIDGEMLNLLKSGGEEMGPTGIATAVRNRKPAPHEEWDGVSFVEYDEMICPACDAIGAIEQRLSSGARCPKCHDGKIEMAGWCIY